MREGRSIGAAMPHRQGKLVRPAVRVLRSAAADAKDDFVLSQRTRYAIRALLHLGDRYGQGPVQLTEIAEAQNIPAKFLTVILSEMKRARSEERRAGNECVRTCISRVSQIQQQQNTNIIAIYLITS